MRVMQLKKCFYKKRTSIKVPWYPFRPWIGQWYLHLCWGCPDSRQRHLWCKRKHRHPLQPSIQCFGWSLLQTLERKPVANKKNQFLKIITSAWTNVCIGKQCSPSDFLADKVLRDLIHPAVCRLPAPVPIPDLCQSRWYQKLPTCMIEIWSDNISSPGTEFTSCDWVNPLIPQTKIVIVLYVMISAVQNCDISEIYC